MSEASHDYECSACTRKQSKVGIRSGQLITQADIESIGWKKSGDAWFCLFHSGEEEKMRKFFMDNSNG